MNINEKKDQLIAQFSTFDDWMDRYNLLIELGKSCPILDDKDKTEAHLIQGCQSRVWLTANLQNGKMILKADSDAVITKGIAALLIYVFSDENPQEVVDADLDFIEKIGLREHLSPTRSNGLNAMIKQIKLYALALSLKLKSEN
ncbi:MAG: SufE family protein [Bacteroidales bacterium]